MKKILFIVFMLLIYGCRTGYIEKLNNKNLFDQFDYKNWNDDKYKEGIRFGSYIYKGIEIDPGPDDNDDGYSIFIHPQKKQFYTIYNHYYASNFNLKERGKFFGRGQGVAEEGSIEKLKIGIWEEYDEKRNLIKQTDEDKKFGKFGYNELLKFLDAEKQINLNKGVEIDNKGKPLFETFFHYSNESEKKLWTVIIYKSDGETQNKGYFIDGNTGKVLENISNELNYYREIGVKF